MNSRASLLWPPYLSTLQDVLDEADRHAGAELCRSGDRCFLIVSDPACSGIDRVIRYPVKRGAFREVERRHLLPFA